jgi:hypothetical protein
MEQYSEFSSYGNDGTVSRLLASTRCQMESPLSQVGVLPVSPENLVGTLDQRRAQIDVAGLGNAELRIWISFAGLAAPRSQAEIATHIATSLATVLAPQSQDIRQRRELPDSVDHEQGLRLWVLGLRELLDQPVIMP